MTAPLSEKGTTNLHRGRSDLRAIEVNTAKLADFPTTAWLWPSSAKRACLTPAALTMRSTTIGAIRGVFGALF